MKRGIDSRFLRLEKIDGWRDFNEFELIAIVIKRRNGDEERLKEFFEKSETIEGIRWNGVEFVGEQPT